MCSHGSASIKGSCVSPRVAVDAIGGGEYQLCKLKHCKITVPINFFNICRKFSHNLATGFWKKERRQEFSCMVTKVWKLVYFYDRLIYKAIPMGI